MENRKPPHLAQSQYSMQRTTSASAIGTNHVTKEKSRQSEGATPGDTLPPKAPSQTSGSNSGGNSNTAGKVGGLRLGGLSRYLLEKAQSNDSGLDLSPATLQTLVHPIRNSNSSSSSLHVRNLFESPASASSFDESPHGHTPHSNIESSVDVPTTSPVSRSLLSEKSQNASETTVIEKTLTDEQSSKNFGNNTAGKKDPLQPIYENHHAKERATKDGVTSGRTQQHNYYHYHPHQQNPDNITPKDRGFQVPYGYSHQPEKTKTRTSNGNSENADPRTISAGVGHTYGGHQHHQNNRSFPSSDVAAVIPSAPPASSAGEQSRKYTMQTPKPKSCKKKSMPSSTKKPTGSGWKFLSEHVQDKEFLILEQLGKGGCGEVSLVMEKDTRKQFALKIVQLHGFDEAIIQDCINEVEMLIDLKDTDLVVDIHNWEFNRAERTMKILMEKGQCDLNHTILKAHRTKKPLKLLKIKYIWESLLTIVQEIHSKDPPIVHADLKPANFVWVDDNLKLIDFGIAKRLQSDLTSIAMPNPMGTLNFVSPEIIRQDDSGRSKLSPKSDIWALGCILYLMVYGRTPFEHITHQVPKMQAIIQGDIMYPTLPPHLRESDVLSVLKLCFQPDYKQRPSATELLRHAFLQT